MKFKANKYTILYYALVNKDWQMLIYERHHILPKSLGGTNSPTNIVCVPPRVHFILHRLLCKMVDGNDLKKMRYALWIMMQKERYRFTSRHYEKLRLQIIQNPLHGGFKKGNEPWNKGISMSEDFKKKVSSTMKGRSAWNKGTPNPQAVENARKGATKQAETVKGRRRSYREDGSWYWSYPNKNGP